MSELEKYIDSCTPGTVFIHHRSKKRYYVTSTGLLFDSHEGYVLSSDQLYETIGSLDDLHNWFRVFAPGDNNV